MTVQGMYREHPVQLHHRLVWKLHQLEQKDSTEDSDVSGKDQWGLSSYHEGCLPHSKQVKGNKHCEGLHSPLMFSLLPSGRRYCSTWILMPRLGLKGKSLIFLTKTDKDYVKLNAADFSSLTAFTVCFRAASEESSRDYSLLSYATGANNNELLIWQKKTGQLTLYLKSPVVDISLPKIDGLLRHVCVNWESQTGVVTAWVNGRRSLQKVGGKGLTVKGSGVFILGQEQDKPGGRFDINQSFVGEITDVNMWDHVLKSTDIELLSQGCFSTGGNIIDWSTIGFTSGGNVKIEDNNDCKF